MSSVAQPSSYSTWARRWGNGGSFAGRAPDSAQAASGAPTARCSRAASRICSTSSSSPSGCTFSRCRAASAAQRPDSVTMFGGDAVHRGAHRRRGWSRRRRWRSGDGRTPASSWAGGAPSGGAGLGEDTGGAAAARRSGRRRRRPIMASRATRSDGDAGAEDGGRPGELGGFDAEFARAGRRVRRRARSGSGRAVRRRGPSTGGVRGPGPWRGVPRFRRVAAGDGPHLAAERGVGVGTEGGPGESRGRLGVRALQVGDGRPAAATSSRRRALSPAASPGLRATTTSTGRSSSRSANAASQRRVSRSAQWASSTSSTSGQSRRGEPPAHRDTSPSQTYLGSGLPSPGSAMPRAGPAMSYQ